LLKGQLPATARVKDLPAIPQCSTSAGFRRGVDCYIDRVGHQRRLFLLQTASLLTVLLLARIGLAGGAASPLQSEPPTIHVGTQFVLLDALVENKKSRAPLDALSAKDFELSEDGVAQTISYFSHDQLPLSVVFLFDMTETVHAALAPLAQAALQVLGHLKPEDEVAVMTFSSRADLMQDFTINRKLAAEAVRTASWMADVEGTFLDEDMVEAVDQVMKAKEGNRRVLVWLTDGTANEENAFTRATIGQHAPARLHSQREAMTRLLQSDAVVSVLIDRTAETYRAIAGSGSGGTRLGDIDEYARATGGPLLSASTKEVPEDLALLIDQVRARYTLGYKPSAAGSQGKFCKLSLRLSPEFLSQHPELRKQDLVVMTRSGYYR
jgi:VWFA-related protein